jgi:phosphoenolpyruvate carboxykinase (ATP)
VNTGWNGSGKRISIKSTRAIIDAILDGSIDATESLSLPIFNLVVPATLPGVETQILDPRNSYSQIEEWQTKANELARLFIDNFAQYTDTDRGRALVSSGPIL